MQLGPLVLQSIQLDDAVSFNIILLYKVQNLLLVHLMKLDCIHYLLRINVPISANCRNVLQIGSIYDYDNKGAYGHHLHTLAMSF